MFKRKSRFSNCVGLAAFGLAVLLALPASALAAETRYLILMKEGGKVNSRFSSKVEKAGGEIKLVIDQVDLVVATSEDPDFRSRMQRVRDVQEVAFSRQVRMDEDIQFTVVPNNGDSHIGEDEFFYPLQWGIDMVGAPAAWNAGLTGAGARVAVLDSGIDHDNADLVSNINQDLSISFMPCVFQMNCDGEMEDWRVREIGDYPEYDNDDGSFFNHGTHVAGTIAAADGGGGGIGVAPEAEIVAVKVCTEFDTFCNDDAIMAGIIYAASIEADIINMSLGGVFDMNPSEFCKFLKEVEPGTPCGRVYVSQTRAFISTYRRIISYAQSQGTTLIVSAGNSGHDVDHTKSLVYSFGGYPNVLAISAVAPVGSALPAIIGVAPPAPLAGPDTLSYYSNYGRSMIDFAAPGGSVELAFHMGNPFGALCAVGGFLNYCFWFDTILSNAPGDYFFFAQGTSMAAPHAAGVAALIVGMNGGDMAPKKLHAAMKKYAEDLGQRGKDPVFGSGLVSGAGLGD